MSKQRTLFFFLSFPPKLSSKFASSCHGQFLLLKRRGGEKGKKERKQRAQETYLDIKQRDAEQS